MKVLLMIAASAAVFAASATAESQRGPASRNAAMPQKPKTEQPLTRAQLVKNLEAEFKAIDTNGDGVLSQSELAAAEAKAQQQRLAQIRAQMEAEFDRLDTNHDGTLSKAEFMAAAPQLPTTPPTGTDLMGRFDKNHDGKVTLDEFRAPMLQRFDQCDTNHDGVLQPEELRACATPPRP